MDGLCKISDAWVLYEEDVGLCELVSVWLRCLLAYEHVSVPVGFGANVASVPDHGMSVPHPGSPHLRLAECLCRRPRLDGWVDVAHTPAFSVYVPVDRCILHGESPTDTAPCIHGGRSWVASSGKVKFTSTRFSRHHGSYRR